MGLGRDAAEAAIDRVGMARLSAEDSRTVLVGHRDATASTRGTGAGGWSDADVDEFVDTLNDRIHGR